MANVNLSERELRALTWAVAVLKETNPGALTPPHRSPFDRSDLITAITELNRVMRSFADQPAVQ